jgi:glutaconate CoA-transferase subunit B
MRYTRQEMMAVATGREIRDGELAIFGVGLSMIAGFFAKAHHAPNVRAITEAGIFGATPGGGLPLGVECNRISADAVSFTGALDALGFLVASGRCDVGIVGAAQLDRFGNVNTTGIWNQPLVDRYVPPRIRLTGSGGANEIAVGCKRFVIMAAHEKKRFVERVDYVSSPGYLDGGEARGRFHFVGGGPSAIVTTLGILRPDPVSKEFVLDAFYAFSSIEEIRDHTGWDLKVSPHVRVVPEPSASELVALRKVDETGILRRG